MYNTLLVYKPVMSSRLKTETALFKTKTACSRPMTQKYMYDSITMQIIGAQAIHFRHCVL